MDSIELLMNEHKNIRRILLVIRKLAQKILKTGEVDTDSYFKIVDFARVYTDQHHHSKEEDILFKEMATLGEEVETGPIAKMLNEHYLGRMFIQKLEVALHEYLDGNTEVKIDIIANSVAYADILLHHIDKEDEAVYVYGKANLSSKTLDAVRDRVKKIEREAEQEGLQEKYISLLQDLESRV